MKTLAIVFLMLVGVQYVEAVSYNYDECKSMAKIGEALIGERVKGVDMVTLIDRVGPHFDSQPQMRKDVMKIMTAAYVWDLGDTDNFKSQILINCMGTR